MPKLKSWIFTAGLCATAPGAAMAGPFGLTLPWEGGKAEPTAAATAEAPRDNQQVAEQIATALRAAGVSGTGINIEYIGGVATLTGGVANPAVKGIAGSVVAKVPGVTSVTNSLQVAAPTVSPAAPAATRG
ncbi:MAG: BON domain-containing protein, partial [Planctomycetota bacterium]